MKTGQKLTTGNQGSSVARALTEQPDKWEVYGLTRNPDSDAAKAIAALGVKLVKGDMDDPKSYAAALEGSYGAFIVANCESGSTLSQAGSKHRSADSSLALVHA